MVKSRRFWQIYGCILLGISSGGLSAGGCLLWLGEMGAEMFATEGSRLTIWLFLVLAVMFLLSRLATVGVARILGSWGVRAHLLSFLLFWSISLRLAVELYRFGGLSAASLVLAPWGMAILGAVSGWLAFESSVRSKPVEGC